MGTWPYPGDSPVARARRIAQAYRTHLHALAPDVCGQLDSMCHDWGETWVAPRVAAYELDDWLTPAEAADIASVSVDTIRQWRHRGRLAGRQDPTGWRYLARDVLAVVRVVRRRAG